MIYPVKRFIRVDLATTTQQFCKDTSWQTDTLDRWHQQHLSVEQLPIAILKDLSDSADKEMTVADTLQKLMTYENEYYHYIKDQRNHFSRIPNASYFLNDLTHLSAGIDEEKSIKTTTSALDQRVYQDLFTPRQDLDNELLQQHLTSLDNSETLKNTSFKFLVKILKAPNGSSLPFYEYRGWQRG